MPGFTGGGSSVSSSNIVDDTIVNADISTSAAIAATKLLGDDTAYSAAWNGDTKPSSKNTVYDIIEARTAAYAKTLIPLCAINPYQNSTPTQVGVGTNTTMLVGQVILTAPIIANKISFPMVSNGGTTGTLDLTMYSEDGQTQIFSVTTASLNAATSAIVETALSAVTIPPGIYYIAINPNGTANIFPYFYTTTAIPWSDGGLGVGLPGSVTSKPVMQGTVTITAGTPPATITPASITEVDTRTLIFRLDN